MNPNEIAEQAIAARQYRAQTYLAGMTPVGLTLCVERTDLHYLWDTMGKMYTDLTSGGGALPMGAYHQVNSAIWSNPTTSYAHVSRYGDSCLQPQVVYAEALSEKFPKVDDQPQQVWFTDSGDQAIQLAHRLAAAISPMRTNVKLIDGDTYEPLDTGQAQKIARIGFDREGAIIVDERLTAFGRFGSFRAAQRYDLDALARWTVTVLGESAGGGVPIGAVVAPRHLWDRLPRRSVASGGGNPIACSAGLRVLQLQDSMFYDHVRDLAVVFEEACDALRSQFPKILLSHTGRGMLRSVLINEQLLDPSLLTKALLDNGVIAEVRGSRLLLAPPLIMTEVAIGSAFDQIASALVDVDKVVSAPA